MANLKNLFRKTEDILPEELPAAEHIPDVPAGVWIKCPKCQDAVYKDDVVKNSYVCPKCGGYFRMKAKTRIKLVADAGTFVPWYEDLQTKDPLNFPDYREKLQDLKEKTHLDEAVRIGLGKIGGIDAVIGACDTRFLMASMGWVVGEKITRAVEEATRRRLPVVMFCCSGGARMQEGITSLMQMAKTSAALKRHSEAGLFYLSVLTDPTTGGVTASFAMLGDVILAEPGALIGFAGPRVIAQTIGQKLPEGFQRAEFLQEHGIIDGVVDRKDLKAQIVRLLSWHCCKMRLPQPAADEVQAETVSAPKTRRRGLHKNTELSAWDRVQIARSSERPTSLDYIERIFDDFMELHGDRAFRDDGAIVGGIASMEGAAVTVIGVQKGKTTKENIFRNFGMPSPEGYRKALRLMKQAEKFGRPIITFIDTPGAFCGMEAEERGQGEAIARNLMEMVDLKVPVLAVVIGEGGSGGALALGVANEVWMMENATYSILSPEGFASILWKDSKRAKEAAQVMKVTAADLLELQVIERIIPEEHPADKENLAEISGYMKQKMCGFLAKYQGEDPQKLAEQRYERFRRM